MRLLLFLLCLLCASSLSAQYDWDDFVEEYTSDVERAEEEDLQLHLQELKELAEHPLNINTATVEDMLQLPFLSEAQIEQIHAYIYLHGQMQTLAELRLVPLIDDVTRRRISLFCYAEPIQQKGKDRLLGHLHHDFSTRLDVPLYYRLGQQNNGYRGDATYHRMRYTIGNSRHFQAGLRVEKDAGERYYDSYGAYAMLHDVGFLRRAIVGDYRIGFGEGLVMGGSIWNSKSTPPLKTQGGIRPMTGMDEANFLRGAAVTLALGKHINLSAFGSYRKRDATLTNKGEVQTLLTSGYHRTDSEWERRRNVGSTVLGGNIEWYNKGFHLGATGYWQKFSRSLNPGKQLYRAIYPRGNSFGTVGVNYGYTRYRLSLAGETAYSSANGGGWATVNRASWNIGRNYILSAVQRFYAYQYYSFYSSALSENSNAQNESGVLVHLQAEPLVGLQLTAYADFFHHPWPRYRMTHSSTGQEFMLQGVYALSRRHNFLARYQLKRKENGDLMEQHHRVKLQWTCEPSNRLRLQTTGSFHGVLDSKGFMLTQNARFILAKVGMSFNGQLGWFHTDDYLSRIYVQQPSLYSSVSSASYYGHGMLGVLTCRWQSKNQRWMIEGRYGMVRYFDRDEQGSGLQRIFSPWKNDLSVQLRMKL